MKRAQEKGRLPGMAYTVKTPAPCADCKRLTNRRQNSERTPRCFECALRRAIDLQRQMRTHSGPFYEKWRAKMSEFAATLPQGTSPPPNE